MRYDKTVNGKVSVRQEVLRRSFLRWSVRTAKCPSGDMSHGEKSFGEMFGREFLKQFFLPT